MQTYLKDLRWGRFNLIEGDMISSIASHYGEWSETEVSVFRHLIDENSNIIEVGSNIGMHAVPLAKTAHRGKLLCFEPQRIIFQQLCCNLALNNLTNVETYRLGVSDEKGECFIESSNYDEAWNYGSFSLNKGFSTEFAFKGEVYKEKIEIVSLDDFPPVQALPSLDLLKIDAEGLDLNVLKGAAETIGRLQPAIFVEIQTHDMVEICDYLKSLDYIPYWVVSERFQKTNYYQAARLEHGYDCNFLALPKQLANKPTKLSSIISVLQAVESVEDLAKGNVKLLETIR